MRQTFKKIFKLVFGTEDNISFILNLSLLLTSIIFFILASAFHADSNSSVTVTYIAVFFFCIWLDITQGADSSFKLGVELFRLMFFLILFIFCTYDCLVFCSCFKVGEIPHVILCALGLLFCSIYFIAKLNIIFNFIKNLFFTIKIKLFNSTQPAATKTKALLENITTFLISISGFVIAIKGIIEVIFQIFKLF